MAKIIAVAVLVLLGGLLLLEAGLSLEWRMVHDAPLFMYMAFGTTHLGYVPYVDFFDMNAPGAHYFHVIVGRVFGYGDLAFRLADLVWLALLLVLTWFTLHRFSQRVAYCGAILFGLLYLAAGPNMSLQREYIALVPIAGAFLAATSLERLPCAARWLLVGLLFGIAATMKPATAIGLPAVVVFGVLDERARAGEARSLGPVSGVVAFSVLGLLVPLALTALHLTRIGALGSFIEIARGYWPLYGGLSRTHEAIGESERMAYLAREWVALGGRGVWLLPAALGSFAALFRSNLERRERGRVLLLVVLAVCYSLYPVIGGKFWTYHWFPFTYFVVLLAALAIAEAAHWKRARWVPALAFVLAVAAGVRSPAELPAQMTREEWLNPRVRRADRIAGFLTENVRPGDTVQPLDWTGGAIHAMLMAKVPLATPFVYDFHFYHDVSTDYIQSLRSRFLRDLETNPPRFIIRVETMRPWVSGEDTEKRFVDLDRFVAANYEEAHAGFGYRIYELKQTGSSSERTGPQA